MTFNFCLNLFLAEKRETQHAKNQEQKNLYSWFLKPLFYPSPFSKMLNGSKIYPPKHYSDSFNFEIGINRLSNGSDLWIVRTPLTTATQLSGTSVKITHWRQCGHYSQPLPLRLSSHRLRYIHYLRWRGLPVSDYPAMYSIRSSPVENHAIFTDNRPLRNKNSK